MIARKTIILSWTAPAFADRPGDNVPSTAGFAGTFNFDDGSAGITPTTGTNLTGRSGMRMKRSIFTSALVLATVVSGLLMSGCATRLPSREARNLEAAGSLTGGSRESVPAATFIVLPTEESWANFDLYISGDAGENRIRLRQAKRRHPGFSVDIPAGVIGVTINASVWVPGGSQFKGGHFSFTAFPGRVYELWPFFSPALDEVEYHVYESSQLTEPNPDEQLLMINYDRTAGYLVIVLNKGSRDERSFFLSPWGTELRIIVPRGEHSIDIVRSKSALLGMATVEPNGVQLRNFTASSDPIEFSVSAELLEQGDRWGRGSRIGYSITQR